MTGPPAETKPRARESFTGRALPACNRGCGCTVARRNTPRHTWPNKTPHRSRPLLWALNETSPRPLLEHHEPMSAHADDQPEKHGPRDSDQNDRLHRPACPVCGGHLIEQCAVKLICDAATRSAKPVAKECRRLTRRQFLPATNALAGPKLSTAFHPRFRPRKNSTRPAGAAIIGRCLSSIRHQPTRAAADSGVRGRQLTLGQNLSSEGMMNNCNLSLGVRFLACVVRPLRDRILWHGRPRRSPGRRDRVHHEARRI